MTENDWNFIRGFETIQRQLEDSLVDLEQNLQNRSNHNEDYDLIEQWGRQIVSNSNQMPLNKTKYRGIYLILYKPLDNLEFVLDQIAWNLEILWDLFTWKSDLTLVLYYILDAMGPYEGVDPSRSTSNWYKSGIKTLEVAEMLTKRLEKLYGLIPSLDPIEDLSYHLSNQLKVITRNSERESNDMEDI